MQYRCDKLGNAVSALGYGCLRFTKRGGAIDVDKAEREVMAAIEGGVNYLDTAYIYPGSEAAVGEILGRNRCRDRVLLATKLPHYLVKSPEGLERIFQEQLRRLGTEYVDYYLMHMLTDVDTWERLRRLGMEEWLEEKRARGQIRGAGFSYHGPSEMFCRLLEVYDWDLCQIQYNYMDEHAQAGVDGLRRAHEKGLPVVVMEPLRGGRLVERLPDTARELFRRDPAAPTPAALAFRWLLDQPEITCVLSGMNSLEMVAENLATADAALPGCMTGAERLLVERVREEIGRYVKVGCTGCGYCMPCPRGVDIPGTFRCYNAMYTETPPPAGGSICAAPPCAGLPAAPPSASNAAGAPPAAPRGSPSLRSWPKRRRRWRRSPTGRRGGAYSASSCGRAGQRLTIVNTAFSGKGADNGRGEAGRGGAAAQQG